jgi:hypothetical protein
VTSAPRPTAMRAEIAQDSKQRTLRYPSDDLDADYSVSWARRHCAIKVKQSSAHVALKIRQKK